MAVISKAIPTLLRGVSQAADLTKQPDHAEIQDNANSSPVQGLIKRSGAQYITTLSSSTLGNVHIQTINRDVSERYVTVFSNGNVKVFDLDGNEKTVNKPDGVTYLSTTNPRDNIKTVTIADYTFVVNTSTVTKMQEVTTAGPQVFAGGSIKLLSYSAVVFINQVSANTNYSVTVNSRTATYDSLTSDLDTNLVAGKLRLGLLGTESGVSTTGSALTGFTIQQNGPVIWIYKDDATNFTIDATDTQGDTQITLVKDSVQTFTDLPVVAPNGFIVEVKGDETTNFDNYYVKFITNNAGALEQGQWEETAKVGITYKLDYSTMPHVLLRQANGEFRFAQPDGNAYSVPVTTATYSQSGTGVSVTSTAHGLAVTDVVIVDFTSGNGVDGASFTVNSVPNANTFSFTGSNSQTTSGNCSWGKANNYILPKWGERTVGDLDTAPNPSFINRTINNVFFFRNRLGFLTDDNVVLSKTSGFFDFFPETVTTIIDSDPIDIAASHTKVSILKHAVPMGEQLILFSDQTQFILESSTNESLTPKTANVTVTTEFENNTAANPLGGGSSIYFLTKKGAFTGVREYITQEGLNVKDAADTTIHVPRYIESGIFKMAISTNENILVLLGTDNPNKLYVNRWLYGENNQKVLNSWSTYTFNSAKTIRNIDFIDTDLYLIAEETNGTTLEKIPFESDYQEANTTFEYHLDHKVTEATTGVSKSYTSSTGLTTFTMPYRLNGTMNIVGRYLASGETSTYVNSIGQTVSLKPGEVIQTTHSSDGSTSTLTATGDYTNSKFIAGEKYEMHYRFSKQRLTESDSSRGELIGARLQLRYFYLKHEDTGYFKVEVTPDNRDTSTHIYNGNTLGTAASLVGSIYLGTGAFRFPVLSKADSVNIDIKNDTFLPTQLANAEYEAMFHMRSRRV